MKGMVTMEKYFTAKTYENMKRIGEPFVNEKGRLFTKVKGTCERCGGLGYIASGVLNGRPVPISRDGGVCYECNGDKYVIKEVRLYTEKEFNSLEKQKEKKRVQKEEEREKKILDGFADRRKEWLAANEFSIDEKTYVYFKNDSYEKKDELKAFGFKFNSNLMWHIADPREYADSCFEVALSEVVEISAWGEGEFLASAKQAIKDKIASFEAPSTSVWLGKEKEKLSNLRVTLVKTNGFSGKFGWTYIYNFKDADGNALTWFTSKILTLAIGEEVNLSGTIKSLDEYNREKITVVTRCKIEKSEVQ